MRAGMGDPSDLSSIHKDNEGISSVGRKYI